MQRISTRQTLYVLDTISSTVFNVLPAGKSLEELFVSLVSFCVILLCCRISTTMKNGLLVIFVHRLVYTIYMWKYNVSLLFSAI